MNRKIAKIWIFSYNMSCWWFNSVVVVVVISINLSRDWYKQFSPFFFIIIIVINIIYVGTYGKPVVVVIYILALSNKTQRTQDQCEFSITPHISYMMSVQGLSYCLLVLYRGVCSSTLGFKWIIMILVCIDIKRIIKLI